MDLVCPLLRSLGWQANAQKKRKRHATHTTPQVRMIQSIFILSPTGEVLIERHFRGVTPRSVCDYYWQRVSAPINHHGGYTTASSAFGGLDPTLHDTVPPIMEVPSTTMATMTSSSLSTKQQQLLQHSQQPPQAQQQQQQQQSQYLFSVLRDGLSYLACCTNQEVSPLLVLEFLHRIADTFVDYFGNPADESAMKDNFSTVYQLLEEMVDYGWPLTTEPNALKAMIRPPTVIRKASVCLLYFRSCFFLLSMHAPDLFSLLKLFSSLEYSQVFLL